MRKGQIIPIVICYAPTYKGRINNEGETDMTTDYANSVQALKETVARINTISSKMDAHIASLEALAAKIKAGTAA